MRHRECCGLKMKKDTPIMITAADRSIGGRAFVYAAWIGEGFDWESNQIRIATDEKILKYKNGRDVAKSPIIRKYERAGKKIVVRKCSACENKIEKRRSFLPILRTENQCDVRGERHPRKRDRGGK